MATQLRSTRQLSIAGETLDWTEVDPYVWELAFPGGAVIGQVVEIPAHGRSKQAWQRQDTQQQYLSAMTACSDLLTAYYRKQAQQPAPSAPEPTPDPAPRLALVPKAERPTGVPEGWLTIEDAAQAYQVPKRTIRQWVRIGQIESVLVPGGSKPNSGRRVAPVTECWVAPPTPEYTPPPTADTTNWLSTPEVGKRLGITETAVGYQIRTGKLRAVRDSNWRWRVDPASIPTADAPDSPDEIPPELTINPPGNWVSVQEAARILGVTSTTVHAWVKTGRVRGRIVQPPGKRWQWEVLMTETPNATIPEPEPAVIQLPLAEPTTTPESQTAPDTSDWLPVDQAAIAYGITERTIWRRIAQKKIEAVKVDTPTGLQWRIQPPAIVTEIQIPPEGWVKGVRAAALAHNCDERTIRRYVHAGKIATLQINGGWYYSPPPTPEPESAPAPTSPLPAPVALSEFASPTIEVQHTPPSDDHPLEPDPAPTLDMRLLAAYERIGYLTAQLEHWQAEAELYKQEIARLMERHYPAPDGDPDLGGPVEPTPRKRRWFNW